MANENSYFLKPGGIYVSSEPTFIHTVLGSCVSICIYDNKNGVGGMNHFLYHHAIENIRNCRYGDIAIPHLINLVYQTGGKKDNLTAHIIGGAQSMILDSNVGRENIKIAKKILSLYEIPLDTVDVGGAKYRKIIFHNISGQVIIKKGNL